MAQRVLQSETTQNVAAGNLGTAGGIAACLALVRQVAPDLLPWNIEGDAALVAFVATVGAPLVSRWMAFWRNPGKQNRYYAGPGGQHR